MLTIPIHASRRRRRFDLRVLRSERGNPAAAAAFDVPYRWRADILVRRRSGEPLPCQILRILFDRSFLRTSHVFLLAIFACPAAS